MSDDNPTLQQQLDDVRNALRQARQLVGTHIPAAPPNVEAQSPVVEV